MTHSIVTLFIIFFKISLASSQVAVDCRLDKRNFAECLMQKEDVNVEQDETRLRLIHDKLGHCFTDNNCQPPSYEKATMPPVNVTGGMKHHWDGLPPNVQDCIRRQLRDKTVLKLATCIAPDDRFIQKVSPLNQTTKGYKTFFQTKYKVLLALEECKQTKGEVVSSKVSTCVQQIVNYVEDEICARYSSCQFEKVGTLCLQPVYNTHVSVCKCKRDHLKNTTKAVNDLYAKSANVDITLEELSTALGRDDEATNLKKESQLQGCLADSGISAPLVAITNTLPPNVQRTTAPPNVETGTKPVLTTAFESNIVVGRQQLLHVRLMLEARLDEEACKCDY